MMKFGRARASRDFGIAVILLAPFWFIGTMLMAITVCHDFYQFSGELPIALGVIAPAAYLVVRWAAPAVSGRLLAAWEMSASEAAQP